ncbi:MAG TPA: SAM-dependent methyltransferase [Elusimicrobiota bacterium]|nr:SAM-dependent methyltransferase [Elusimicrobiota bacterium]
MNELETVIHQEIARRGPIPFDKYMEWALYHPLYGYYMRSSSRVGREGDFLTSPRSGSLFARLLAEQIAGMWDWMGNQRFTIVELGSGAGLMAEQILSEFQARGRGAGLSYVCVEISPPAREQARRKLSRFSHVQVAASLDSLEHVSGVDGCVLSNEYFDALPVKRIVSRGGGLKEYFVGSRNGVLVDEEGALETDHPRERLDQLGLSLSDGQTAEISLGLDSAVSSIGRILRRGFVLTVDYGFPARDLYSPGRPQGTLRCYHQHRIAESPYLHVGEQDMTAHVDFTTLASLGMREDLQPLVFTDQGSFLLSCGEKILKEAVEQDVPPARRLKINGEIKGLLHPSALGLRYQVLIQGKGVGLPDLSGGKINRLSRLGLNISV